MPSRSQPIALNTVHTRTGKVTYRVTGTVNRGQKPRKLVTMDYEDALATQTLWEHERIRGAAQTRPKITHLTQAQIREAEAAFELLKNEPFGLLDLVKHGMVHRPTFLPKKPYQEAVEIYLERKKPHVSESHFAAVSQRCRNFGAFLGNSVLLTEIGDTQVRAWLNKKATKEDGSLSLKTWNNLAGDVSAVFTFCVGQKWLHENPFSKIERFNRRSMKTKTRERLSAEKSRDLMQYLEEHHSDWCCFFAITLFAGIRPDMKSGEMRELSRCVARDGIEPYYSAGALHLSAEITKEGEARQTTVHPNLRAWLEKYPPNPKALCPAGSDVYARIRNKFNIPHDGLRHTAISFYVAKNGSLATAALEFGNSEAIIRRHYLHRATVEEANAFYEISPKP